MEFVLKISGVHQGKTEMHGARIYVFLPCRNAATGFFHSALIDKQSLFMRINISSIYFFEKVLTRHVRNHELLHSLAELELSYVSRLGVIPGVSE